MRKLIDTGWCVGVLLDNKLIITSPDYVDGAVYTPSVSVHIVGKDGLIALRDALIAHYPIEGE